MVEYAKYLTISALISLIFGAGMLAAALSTGMTAGDSAYTAGGLALLSFFGFGLAELILPRKNAWYGVRFRKLLQVGQLSNNYQKLIVQRYGEELFE